MDEPHRSFARNLADGIWHEYEPSLCKAYLILPALKPVLDNSTDVALIAVLYRIVKNRIRWLTANHRGYHYWQRAHQAVISILALFALADTALYIYAHVLLFGLSEASDLEVDRGLLKVADSYRDIHLVYLTLYFASALEILGWILFIVLKARPQKLKSRVNHFLNEHEKTSSVDKIIDS